MRKRVTCRLLPVLAGLGLGLGLAVAGATGALAEDIKVAHVYGKTGPYEAYAKQSHTGLMMGLEYATDGTMEIGGRKIVVIEKDSQLKPDIGKAALAAEHQAGPKQGFVTLTIDDPDDGASFGEAVYLSTVLVDGDAAGLVVSAGYGHRTGKLIAMAVVDRDVLANGGAFSVDVLGRERRAHLVAGDVLYDPQNELMKV